MTPRSRDAFTLLELMVVIAIVGLLSILSFPIMGSFRKQSRNVECIRNIKTLGTGISLFISDHNGRFPPTIEEAKPRPTFGTDVPDFGPSWAEFVVARYLGKDKTVLRCPSRPSDWGAKSYVGYYPEYGFNERLCPIDPVTKYRVGYPVSAIANLSKLIILADTARYSGGKPVGGYYRIYGATDLHPRHLQSHVNVLYGDQHVETHEYDASGSAPAATTPLGSGAFVPTFN